MTTLLLIDTKAFVLTRYQGKRSTHQNTFTDVPDAAFVEKYRADPDQALGTVEWVQPA